MRSQSFDGRIQQSKPRTSTLALQTLRRLNTLEETPTIKREFLASTSSNQLDKLGTETTSPTWGQRPLERRVSNNPITEISLRSGSMSPLGISRDSSQEFFIDDSSRKVGKEVKFTPLESLVVGGKVSPSDKVSPIGSRRSSAVGSRSPVNGSRSPVISPTMTYRYI
jgi:hypothetical protein